MINLGPLRQSAFVVSDMEAAAAQWVAVHGVGPWTIFDFDLADAQYRGETTRMKARMGLAQSGGQQIELIEPDLAYPSLYKEFLDNGGGSGLHHVCYWADIDAAQAHFTGQGAEVVQHGETSNGNRFLYMTGACGVPYVEIVDPNESMTAFFDHIADIAKDWDGTNPIRTR